MILFKATAEWKQLHKGRDELTLVHNYSRVYQYNSGDSDAITKYSKVKSVILQDGAYIIHTEGDTYTTPVSGCDLIIKRSGA